jgi:DNA-binding NarL/FixJ family response regulator
MLTDIVRSVIGSQPDFAVVGEITSLDGIARAAREVAADVVILDLPTSSKISVPDLLYAHPRSRVIAIHPSGRSGELHELRPQVVPLGETLDLVAVVRDRTHDVDAGSRT